MSSTLSGQWLWIPARQCSVTRRKSDATVSTAEHPRLHSCWWMGIIFSRSQSFRLLHLGVSCRIWCTKADDVRLQNCKSTGPERGNQKQMEEGHHWDSSKIHRTIQKRLNVVRKQNLGANSAHFRLIAVTGYRCRAVRRVNYWLFCTLRTPNTLFAYFTVKTKEYNVIGLLSVLFSYDCSLKFLYRLFEFYCWAVQHHRKAWDVIYKSPGYINTFNKYSVYLLNVDTFALRF